MQRSTPTTVLDYGATERISVRRAASWLAGAVVVLGVIAFAISTGLSWFNHYEENGVRAALERIPGSRVLRVNAFYDGPGDKVIGADVSVDGSAQRTLRFHAPWRAELRNGTRMSINQIGPYPIIVLFDGQLGRERGLDLGSKSELASVLPFKFDNLRDLAAHYDDIEAFVRQQPSGTFTDATGKVCTWRIEVRQ